MSKEKDPSAELKLADFAFLAAGRLRKMEIRYNSNTSEKLHLHASFMIDHKRDDTEVGVFVTGKDFQECMGKMHEWHENYFKNIKVFGKLVGREDDKKTDTPF